MDNNNYAGFWIRWFAEGVGMVMGAVVFFLGLYLLSAYGSSSLEVFLPNVLGFITSVILTGLLVKFLLHPWLISKTGAGLGKMACGLEIVKEGSNRLTFKNALFREFVAKIASNALLGLGYYWIFRTPQKQGWHDSLAGTYVLKKHNGLFAGILVLIIFLGIEGGLAYQTFKNFQSNLSLQYDLTTLITQIQQDLSKQN